MAEVELSLGFVIVWIKVHFLLLLSIGWVGGESWLYLTSARLKFEVVAKLGRLDAVNAQFEVEIEFVNIDLVIV